MLLVLSGEADFDSQSTVRFTSGEPGADSFRELHVELADAQPNGRSLGPPG